MEVESVRMEEVEDQPRLIQRRFDAAVKVIKSLSPDGECRSRAAVHHLHPPSLFMNPSPRIRTTRSSGSPETFIYTCMTQWD